MGKVENDNKSSGLSKGASLAGKGTLATLKGVYVASRSIIGIVLICTIYLAPTGIAALKGRENVVAIFALNFFLGWSIVGWVVALVWALKSDKDKIVVVQQSK